MGGDIAALSRELFYKENRFKIFVVYLYLPHLSARPLVKTIELIVFLCIVQWKALQKFARDAKDIYEFENLTTVKIRFKREYGDSLEEFSALLESDTHSEMAVVFPFTCKLQVALNEEFGTIYESLERDLKQMIVCG
jgi:hypothetical protein